LPPQGRFSASGAVVSARRRWPTFEFMCCLPLLLMFMCFMPHGAAPPATENYTRLLTRTAVSECVLADWAYAPVVLASTPVRARLRQHIIRVATLRSSAGPASNASAGDASNMYFNDSGHVFRLLLFSSSELLIQLYAIYCLGLMYPFVVYPFLNFKSFLPLMHKCNRNSADIASGSNSKRRRFCTGTLLFATSRSEGCPCRRPAPMAWNRSNNSATAC